MHTLSEIQDKKAGEYVVKMSIHPRTSMKKKARGRPGNKCSI
jgi:hypothetical protein